MGHLQDSYMGFLGSMSLSVLDAWSTVSVLELWFVHSPSRTGQSHVLLVSGDTIASGHSGHQRKVATVLSNSPFHLVRP